MRIGFRPFWAEAQIMQSDAEDAAEHGEIADPLRGTFPETHDPRDSWILGQAAVGLWIIHVVQNVDDAGSTHAGRIVDAGFLEAEVFAKLFGASLGEIHHVVLASEVETAGRTRLDAGGLQSHGHAIDAEGALKHLLRGGIEFGNIEGATTHAISAADAVLLLEIDDAIGVLDNCAIGGAGFEAAGIGAVHALIFAHEQRDAAIFAFVFVELDQVPVIPCGRGHGLVAVVECGFGERITVPLEAGDFAGLAAYAGRGVDEFADLKVALDIFAGSNSSVAGDLSDC